MAESVVAGFVLLVLLGYVGFAAAVGVFASSRGWSFFIFFLLALFFNPVLALIGFLVLDTVMDSTDSDSLAEGARNLAQKGKHAVHQAGKDDERAATSTGDKSRGATATGSEPNTSRSRSKGGLTDETDDAEMFGEPPEGKVRCDTCHSLIDDSASECPACGTRL